MIAAEFSLLPYCFVSPLCADVLVFRFRARVVDPCVFPSTRLLGFLEYFHYSSEASLTLVLSCSISHRTILFGAPL